MTEITTTAPVHDAAFYKANAQEDIRKVMDGLRQVRTYLLSAGYALERVVEVSHDDNSPLDIDDLVLMQQSGHFLAMAAEIAAIRTHVNTIGKDIR